MFLRDVRIFLVGRPRLLLLLLLLLLFAFKCTAGGFVVEDLSAALSVSEELSEELWGYV